MRRRRLRQVEQGGHVMLGPALVEDSFNAIPVALVPPDHASVERRLGGKIAELGPEKFLHAPLMSPELFRRLKLLVSLLTVLEGLLGLAHEIAVEHCARLDLAQPFWQHLQSVRCHRQADR